MSPPNFADLGKACLDVFNKGYNFGLIKVTTDQTTCGGIGFKTDITHNYNKADFKGFLETKIKWPEYGLTYITKWFSNNYMFNGVTQEDYLSPGLKLGLDTLWDPVSGDKSLLVSSQFKNDVTNCELDVSAVEEKAGDFNVNGSVVLGYEGWLTGIKSQIDSAEGLKNVIFSLGHSFGDTQALITCENGEAVKGQLFQRVNDRIESGLFFGWGTGIVPRSEVISATPVEGADEPSESSISKYLGVAGRYLLSPCSSLRAKFDNNGNLGVGCESKVKDGLTVAVSANFDMKNFTGGDHKVGFGVEFGQ